MKRVATARTYLLSHATTNVSEVSIAYVTVQRLFPIDAMPQRGHCKQAYARFATETYLMTSLMTELMQ